MTPRVESNCKVMPRKCARAGIGGVNKASQQKLRHVCECEMSGVIGVKVRGEGEGEGPQMSQIGLVLNMLRAPSMTDDDLTISHKRQRRMRNLPVAANCTPSTGGC